MPMAAKLAATGGAASVIRSNWTLPLSRQEKSPYISARTRKYEILVKIHFHLE